MSNRRLAGRLTTPAEGGLRARAARPWDTPATRAADGPASLPASRLPRVPSFVSTFALSLHGETTWPSETADGGAPPAPRAASPWNTVALPGDLAHAVPKRQTEYRAGRFCAMRALEALGRAASAIGRGPAGEPLWPAGIVGSITHAGDVAWAAVAASTDAVSIGIDSERLGERPRIDRLSAHVLLPREMRVGGDSLDAQQRFTVVFSAKESIYKCLFPLVRVRFYFADVAIASVDVEQGTFAAQVVRPLGRGFDAGRRLAGRLSIGDGYVHTAVWIAPSGEGIDPARAESGRIAGPPFPSILPDSIPGTPCRGAAARVAPACPDPAR